MRLIVVISFVLSLEKYELSLVKSEYCVKYVYCLLKRQQQKNIPY
jgi:hypothetical protein